MALNHEKVPDTFNYAPETKLYHYRARMYNPTIGRFLQTDPIGYADGLNWYAYCGNNPIILIDPMGLDWYDNTTNFVAGAGDFISFGATKKIREWTGIDNMVNKQSKSYHGGEITAAVGSLAVGGGRVAYAGAAKAGSIIHTVKLASQSSKGLAAATKVAQSAVRYRNSLKHIFRGGKSAYKIYDFAKIQKGYSSLRALIAASGRTNKLLNILGGGMLYNGIKSLSNGESESKK